MHPPAQPLNGDRAIRTGDRLAHTVGQHFLWLLLGCYALAAIWPQPGILLREWEWQLGRLATAPLTLSLFLLAVLLFIAALMTDVSRIRFVLQHPLLLASALAAVWLGPAALVVVAGWVVPWAVGGQETAGLLVGLALVAAMPVANSSVGWVQSAAGNLALALALVVLSILLSPWATPYLLSWLGMSLSPVERAYTERLVTNFSGMFFIVWVLLPTAAGFLVRYLVGSARVASAASWLSLVSAIALLILNYTNSALALPKVLESSTSLLVATGLLAAALSVVGLACGWTLARLLGMPAETQTALMFGLSMKHTGLALILAGAVLNDQPLATLMIVLATLMQHLLAGVAQWRMQGGRVGR
jgi:bile acid:Na+ symporter, BASS family